MDFIIVSSMISLSSREDQAPYSSFAFAIMIFVLLILLTIHAIIFFGVKATSKQILNLTDQILFRITQLFKKTGFCVKGGYVILFVTFYMFYNLNTGHTACHERRKMKVMLCRVTGKMYHFKKTIRNVEM